MGEDAAAGNTEISAFLSLSAGNDTRVLALDGGNEEQHCAYTLPTTLVESADQVTKAVDARHTTTLAQDPGKREDLVATQPKDEPILHTLLKPPSIVRPSLGDRFSSINLAHAGLQYFKHRAQSAQAYLPSPLRSVTTAPTPSASPSEDAGPTENSDDATVPSEVPTLADDACAECPEIAGNDEILSPGNSSTMISGEPTDTFLPAVPSPSATDDLSLSLDPAPITLSASADRALSVLGSSVSLDASTESLRDAAPSGCALDVPPASSPILVAVSSDLPLVPIAVLPDSSLAPGETLLEDFAPRNAGSMTLSPNQLDPLQASVNTGAETVSSQARDDLGPPTPEGQLVTATTACALSTSESSLPEVSALLLDLSAPSAPLDADVTGVRVSSDAANVEVPIPPEVKVPLSGNCDDDREEPSEGSLLVLPDDAATTETPSVQSQDVPSPAAEPADALVTVVPPDYVPSSLSSGPLLAVVPDAPSETIPVVASALEPSLDEPMVPSVLETLVSEDLKTKSGLSFASNAYTTIEATPLDDVLDACGEEASSEAEHGSGLVPTRPPEVAALQQPTVPECTVGEEIDVSMDEDATHSDLSKPSGLPEDEVMLADNGGAVDISPEASFTPAIQEPESLSSEQSAAVHDADGPQLMHTTEFMTNDTQERDDVGVSDVSMENYVFVGPLSPAAGGGADLEYALNSSAEDISITFDLTDEHSSESLGAIDLLGVPHSGEDFCALSPPLPPSSPPCLSSPMRSSSPPFVFSSPPSHAFPSSLPTSREPSPPCRESVTCEPDEEEEPIFRNSDAAESARKRKRALDDIDETDGAEFGLFTSSTSAPMSDGREMKRIRLEDASLPSPPATQSQSQPLSQVKRPTFASQLRERRKLTAPFRSPLVDKDAAKQGVHAVYASGRSRPGPKRGTALQKENAHATCEKPTVATGRPQATVTKAPTPKVAKQFKSPFHLDASTPGASSSSQPSSTISSVQAVPTIRALQSKIQTLKQAIKIKNAPGDRDDDALEDVKNKWTSVGREVAWAVWDTVKDLDPGDSVRLGRPGGGWFDDDDAGRGSGRGEEGEKAVEGEEEEHHAQRHTLGTMLRHLGIAPETLGWDEDEGDFVDVE